MLIQSHWQARDGSTEFRAQGGPFESHEEFRKWLDGVMERHPLSSHEHNWFVCNEKSEQFVRQPIEE